MSAGLKVVVADASLLPHRTLFEGGLPAGTTTSWHENAGSGALTADVADADVLVGSRAPAELLRAATGLRLVHAAGAGYDGIDLAALPAGAKVANTFHHERSIAEHVVASLVVLRRGTLQQDAALRTGTWLSPVYQPGLPQPATLDGAVVVFLGFGHIGQATWRLLRAFGAEGIAVTGRGDVDAAQHGLRWAGSTDRLGAALREGDVVVVSVPMLPATTGIVGAAELRALGPGGLLVNVARGPVVDERDLYDALRDGTIAGAALDVWYRYPGGDGRGQCSTLPFGALPNVLMTPHSSGVTADTFAGRAREIAQNVTRLAAGLPLTNLVHENPGGTVVNP